MSSERRTLHVTGDPRIDEVADALVEMYFDPAAQEMQHIGSYELPNEAAVEHIVDECRALLFPGYAGADLNGTRSELRSAVRSRVGGLRAPLPRQVYRALHHKRQQVLGKADLECSECAGKADTIADRLLAHLP